MGIDFGNLIKNLGATAASASGKTDKIDSKNELKEFVSGWDQIKAQAKQDAENSAVVDLQKEAQTQEEIDALAKAELNEIMGLDFAKNDLGIQKKSDMEKGTAFSDEEISLENLMALLDDDVNTEKVAEHNKKGVASAMFADAGFEETFITELDKMDNAREVAKTTKEMKEAGIADEIANDITKFSDEFGDEMGTAGLLFAYADYSKHIEKAKGQLKAIRVVFNDRVKDLVERHKNATDPIKKAEIEVEMMNEELLYNDNVNRLEAIISLEEGLQ